MVFGDGQPPESSSITYLAPWGSDSHIDRTAHGLQDRSIASHGRPRATVRWPLKAAALVRPQLASTKARIRMPKIIWVVMPLGAYVAYLAALALARRRPRRYAINLGTSLLLLLYLAITIGLGLFWVSRQQLPVFDWHYLFGYATIVLVAAHLLFNLPVVWRYVRRRRSARPTAPSDDNRSGEQRPSSGPQSTATRKSVYHWRRVLVIGGVYFGVFSFGLGLGLGMMDDKPSLAPSSKVDESTTSSAPLAQCGLVGRLVGCAHGPIAAVVRYHEYSSLSSAGVFPSAPAIDWGSRPAAFKRYPQRLRIPLGSPNAVRGAERSLSEALTEPVARLTIATASSRPSPTSSVEPPASPETPNADGGTSAAEQGPPPTQNASTLAEIKLPELSALLFHTAGVTAQRGGLKLRAPPSAGGLFPSEVYLIVRRIAELRPGIYHYDAEHQALHRLAEGHYDHKKLGMAAGDDDAPLVVVVTANVRRTGFKYGHRAYRYALADVGHLLANLRVSAAEFGLTTRLSDRFDEARIASALKVQAQEELVAAVATVAPYEPVLDTNGFGKNKSPVSAARFGYGYLPLAHRPTDPLGVVGKVHRATSLRGLDLSSHSSDGEHSPFAAGPLISLPSKVLAPGLALDTIAVRRSERRYSNAPMSLTQLGSLLHDAVVAGPRLCGFVRMSVVVARVDGLEPGIYDYQPRSHQLRLRRSGEFSREAQKTALGQQVVGDAAAIIVFWLDHKQLLQADGARGYRHCLLETGMLGERIGLGAVAWSLGACPIGAYYDDRAAELLKLAPEREWVLHMVTIGRL